MTYVISTIAIIVLTLGLAFRHDRFYHVRFMMLGFVIDLSLVLYIELSRGAVKHLVADRPTILTVHIIISVTVLMAYGCMIVLGRKLLKGQDEFRHLHRNIGITLFALRLANYVTSFMV